MIDTSLEFQAAYVLAAVIYGGYVFSLWWRSRRTRERLDALRAAKRR